MNDILKLVLVTTSLTVSYSYPAALAKTVSVRRLLHLRYPMMQVLSRARILAPSGTFVRSCGSVPGLSKRDWIIKELARVEAEAESARSRSIKFAHRFYGTGDMELCCVSIELDREYKGWLAKAASLKRDLEKNKD